MRTTLLRYITLLAASLLVLSPKLRGDDTDLGDVASVAQTWLGEIDAGRYDQSYIDGGGALHDKVKQEDWVRILKTERPVMGPVVKRTEVSRTPHPDGLEGVEGNFVVIAYRTDFQNKQDELEYVVAKREFGGWRCVGYDFGPEQVETDPNAGPVTTTQTSTNAPPTPTNGITVPAKRNQ